MFLDAGGERLTPGYQELHTTLSIFGQVRFFDYSLVR